MSERGRRECEACGSPLDAAQRYCLACGTRAGGRSPQLETLLSRLRAERRAAPPPADPSPPPPAAARGLPRLPGPWVSAALVLLFAGFGALLGDTGAGAGGSDTASPALKVLVPSHATASSSTTATGARASEPPAAEPQSTPEASQSEAGSQPSSTAGHGTTTSSSSSSSSSSSTSSAAPSEARGNAKKAAATAKLTDVKHVFLIVLDDEPYGLDFGPEAKAAYLTRTLEPKGELLIRYDAVAHEQLPNAIALIGGQGPNPQTAADCPSYTPLAPASAGADEQVLGEGCLYPASVRTLPGQLESRHLAWRAYLQGLEEGAGAPAACAHPAPGAQDPTFASGAYAGYRDPFVYFASITGGPHCAADVVGLGHLAHDLEGPSAAVPALSYIVPGRCDDGGPAACSTAAPTGPADTSAFLEAVVPEITASKAYKQNGLIVITTDEAPSTGEFADSGSCCGQPPYPNLTTTGRQQGGGTVGALLVSPFVKGGTISQEEYDHYSLLKTVEDIFGLGHIGYAALPAVQSFSAHLLNEPLAR